MSQGSQKDHYGKGEFHSFRVGFNPRQLKNGDQELVPSRDALQMQLASLARWLKGLPVCQLHARFC